MPSHIIKPNRDVDYYVEWSSIVDAPTQAGTRQYMVAHGRLMGWASVEDRLARADAKSSSALWYEPTWDDDESYIFEQAGWIRRSQMGEAAALYLANNCDISVVAHLLEPLADEPEARLGGENRG